MNVHDTLVLSEILLCMKGLATRINRLNYRVQMAEFVPAIGERNLRYDYNDRERQENLAGTCHRV